MARRNRSLVIPEDAVRVTLHCSTRCTRQLHLLEGGEAGEPEALRKELLLARLEDLVEVMAVEVSAFAMMDNHVHLLLTLDRGLAAGWSDEEVLRRWWALHPLRDGYNRPRASTEEEAAEALANEALMATCRAKLCSASQFMKEFKQHAAELINRLEETSGPVWAGRFNSVLVEDEEQLVATMIYVDLNPFAAGLCEAPEAGRFTSLCGRLDRDVPAVERGGEAEGGRSGRPDDAADRTRDAVKPGVGPRRPVLPRRRPSGAWLRPMDETVEPQRAPRASEARRPVAAGLSLRVYLRLLDAVSRKLRGGKERMHASARSLLERMDVDLDGISGRVLALRSRYAVPIDAPLALR